MSHALKWPTRSLLCHGIGAALFTISLGCLADNPSGYLLDGNGKPVLIQNDACLQVGPLDNKDRRTKCYERAHTPVHHHIEPLPRDEFGFMLPPESPTERQAREKASSTAKSTAPSAPRYTTKTVRFTTPVAFKLNHAGLSASNRAALLAFINSLEQYRGVERILVTGHTDLSGNRRYNTWLAGKRAESVQRRLLSLGVDPRTLSVSSQIGGGRNVEIEVVVRVPSS